MPEIVSTRSFDGFVINMMDDNIIEFDTSAIPDLEVDIEFAKKHVAFTLEMSGDNKPGGLAYSSPKATLEARKYYAKHVEVFSCLALVANNVMERVMGNFFVGVFAPKIPIRVFSDLEAARKWLVEKMNTQ